MTSSHLTSNLTTDATRHVVKEEQIEYGFIGKLQSLKYKYRLKKLSIFIPALSEQLKISDCLAVFDAQITAKTQQLDALKIHKKGLMQQLFPALEAT